MKRLTTEEFIKRAREVHGDKYDYSRVEYLNNATPVIIKCPEHGEFLQAPYVHLRGSGCQKCNGTEKLTTEEFIKRARRVHSDKYDYSKVEYVGNHDNVCIICPKHGEFLQRAFVHLKGQGCKICSVEKEQAIKEISLLKQKKYMVISMTIRKLSMLEIMTTYVLFVQNTENLCKRHMLIWMVKGVPYAVELKK